jgi:hypothetical protein
MIPAFLESASHTPAQVFANFTLAMRNSGAKERLVVNDGERIDNPLPTLRKATFGDVDHA